ncbi:MAG: DUF3306 domain-containing protein [Caldimonas sp.]
MTDAQDSFLSRWSQRKVRAKSRVADVADASAPSEAASSLTDTGVRAPVDVRPPARVRPPADAQPHADVEPPAHADRTADAPPPALPTMSDVSLLTRASDYSRFVGSGVDRGVSNAAMKKLFTDPRYNIMDGLDTYIDDYGKPDPISRADLRLMRQARSLGLFDDEDQPVVETAMGDPPAPVATASILPPGPIPADLTLEPSSNDDADLRLQQDDAPRRAGAGAGARS